MGEECVFDRLDYCIVHKTDRTTCQTKEWYQRENAALRSSVEALREALVAHREDMHEISARPCHDKFPLMLQGAVRFTSRRKNPKIVLVVRRKR